MLELLVETREFQRFQEKLAYLAWRKYRIPREQAEDLCQSAVAAYCAFRERYENEQNQAAVLVGIFFKKCLEHIDRSVREQKRLRSLAASPDAPRVNPRLSRDGSSAEENGLERLLREERGRAILAALADLRPEAREMLEALGFDEETRQDLIRKTGLNRNTLDSRLHTYRRELRKLLRERGIDI